MIALVELVVFGFLGLTVIYLAVSVYSRSVRREKLEKCFDSEVRTGDRDRYIAEGMAAYEKGLRRRLLVLIYVVPIVVVGVLVWMNFQWG